MTILVEILTVFGSLGVFLYGMRLMSDGLQQTAGARLKQILSFMTTNRFAGVASGFLITSIIQSSSATTVLVVGFVDAALLTLRQAISVIMGANIGTTVTAWIVALFGFKFSIETAALPAIGVGTAMLISKRINRDSAANALIGFGMLFLGLSLLKDSVPDIQHNPHILEFLAAYTNHGFLSFAIFVARWVDSDGDCAVFQRRDGDYAHDDLFGVDRLPDRRGDRLGREYRDNGHRIPRIAERGG